MTTRRLYRSRTDRQIAGVAGGMAEYFDMDPTIMRILWIASVLFGGFTLLLYPVMAFVVPLAPARATSASGAGATGSTGTWGAGATGSTGDGTSTESSATDGIPAADDAGAAIAWTTPLPGAVRDERRGPGASVYLGVLLVVFGVFALADSIIPGWIGHASAGPAVLLALGAMLLVGAARRPAADR